MVRKLETIYGHLRNDFCDGGGKAGRAGDMVNERLSIPVFHSRRGNREASRDGRCQRVGDCNRLTESWYSLVKVPNQADRKRIIVVTSQDSAKRRQIGKMILPWLAILPPG